MKLEYVFTDEQWQKIKEYLPKRKTENRIKIFVPQSMIFIG